MRHVLAAQQAQKARLPGAVRAAQRDPVALFDAEADAAAHGRAAIAHRDVPQQRQPVCVIRQLVQLQGRGLLAIEAHVDMKNVIADGDIVAGLDVLAEIADGLLDVGICYIIAAIAVCGIITIVDGDTETLMPVTGNTGDYTRSNGFQPGVWRHLEIDAMVEEILTCLWMRLLAIIHCYFQWTGLGQLERHGIAARRNETHCCVVFHCCQLIGSYYNGSPPSHINRMESVNILAIVDSLDNLLLVDMLGQWQLNDESIHISIPIQSIHTCEKFLLCNVIFISNES